MDWASMDHEQIRDAVRRQHEAMLAYKAEHLTDAVRAAMVLLGMSEQEYEKRLMKQLLFAKPSAPTQE